MRTAALGILVIGGMALYAVVGVFLGRRLLHGKVLEGHNDVLVPMFLTAGVIYAVLLGFMVVAVWESYDGAKMNAATEAAALVPLYRATSGMPEEVGEKMREYAREYTEAVVEDEWPTQATTGKGSAKARKAIGNMFRAFGDGTISAQQKKDFPFIFQTFMASVKEVTNLRNIRNIQANETVPWVMWLAAIGGAVVVVGMSFLLYMERAWPQFLMTGVMAALIGMLLFICLLLSHPFQGGLAINSEAFENTLEVFKDVDKGN